MDKIAFLLAWRYMLGARHEKNISSMIKVSFFSILIGAFSLALVTAIMNGFEKATHEKMQSIHAQIIMRAQGKQLDYPAIAQVLKDVRAIASFSPTGMHQIIVQTQESDDITNVILLKAIDPQTEANTTGFQQKILATILPQKTLANAVRENNILIGDKLAKIINAQPGSSIELIFTKDEPSATGKVTLHKTTAFVGGIFSTGIEEFDTNMALCSFELFNDLFPDSGVTQINIKLKPDANEEAVIASLRKRFSSFEVYSWKELYPALVAALKLEKYAMFLILALMTLVASMNIISLLFMQITQKRPDIAILKALGIADNTVSAIFMGVALGITFFATVLGLIGACLASWFLETYPLITLPDAYYISYLPAKMEPHLLLIVFVVIMLISLCATWLPARRTRLINISDVLRFQP